MTPKPVVSEKEPAATVSAGTRSRAAAQATAVSTASAKLLDALSLPSGAHYYRCALQVNPFSYVKANSKPTTFSDEGSYNRAIVDACIALGIDVIAVTDHYRADTAASLARAAQDGDQRADDSDRATEEAQDRLRPGRLIEEKALDDSHMESSGGNLGVADTSHRPRRTGLGVLHHPAPSMRRSQRLGMKVVHNASTGQQLG